MLRCVTSSYYETHSLTPLNLFFFSLLLLGFAIPQKTVTILMGGISVFVLIWVLSSIFWWTAFSSGLLIGVHALFRDASMHKDMNDAVAMEGDLHFQPSGPVNTQDSDAQFLNAV